MARSVPRAVCCQCLESFKCRFWPPPAFRLKLPRTGRWRMTPRPGPGSPQFPFGTPIPIWPGNGEGIPDSRLGRSRESGDFSRESGNPPFPDSAGTGNRGPGTVAVPGPSRSRDRESGSRERTLQWTWARKAGSAAGLLGSSCLLSAETNLETRRSVRTVRVGLGLAVLSSSKTSM
jgi:hypothetical protein